MVGNVNEWTRSSYRPYPYVDEDGRNDQAGCDRKVARGGSWADRPADAGASVRRAYQPWQQVYDVGFRVIVEGPPRGGPLTLQRPSPQPRVRRGTLAGAGP